MLAWTIYLSFAGALVEALLPKSRPGLARAVATAGLRPHDDESGLVSTGLRSGTCRVPIREGGRDRLDSQYRDEQPSQCDDTGRFANAITLSVQAIGSIAPTSQVL